jgi:hypothetical protein
MSTHIIIHILPHEIDWFEWQSKQLKIGSNYLDENDKILVDVTLNLNLNDWTNSQIPKSYFIDKFRQIESLYTWCSTLFTIDEYNKIRGCGDKRKQSINYSTYDNIIYLDSDLIFPIEALSILINSSKNITSEYFIISPQITKLWDSTWDILVNEQYQHFPYNTEKTIDPYSVILSNTNFSLIPINNFKFGGGWFNLISTNLLKLTDIPDSLNPYGPDDTYVMACCSLMKQKGFNVQQYMVENLIVAENYKHRTNPYSNYIKYIDNKDNYRLESIMNLSSEITKFNNRI